MAADSRSNCQRDDAEPLNSLPKQPWHNLGDYLRSSTEFKPSKSDRARRFIQVRSGCSSDSKFTLVRSRFV
jgi:hypothetical protein